MNRQQSVKYYWNAYQAALALVERYSTHVGDNLCRICNYLYIQYEASQE